MMAATLFIIKIPKESEEEVFVYPNNDDEGSSNDDKEKNDTSFNEEKENTNLSSSLSTLTKDCDGNPNLNFDPQQQQKPEEDLTTTTTTVTPVSDSLSSNNTKTQTEELNDLGNTASSSPSQQEVILYVDEEEEDDDNINAKEENKLLTSSTKSTIVSPENEKEEEENEINQTDSNTEKMNGSLTPVETGEEENGCLSPEVTMLDFIIKEPLETQLKNILASMSITNITWTNLEGSKQALFVDCGDANRVEDILEKLMSIGIGQKIIGTSVSLFPATVHIENDSVNEEDGTLLSLPKEKESEFKKSVKARMIVAQVVETVRSNAVFTFDYCSLIILASMIAAIGLIENSSVILVASMLISPLMGPILAGTFGITIKNNPLRNLGLCSECIGLTMCIVCGFICGLVVGGIQLQGLTAYVDEWPTMEMKSRGMMRSLWIGVFIALPSGAGVALSVLGGNTGSLVGVAISASLLPPAVNAGMLWAFALLTTISPLENDPRYNSTSLSGLGCPTFIDNHYEPVYSCNMAKEMGIMGTISLLLTLINIFCIFLVGTIMLKIKEVVPQTSSAKTVEFWGHDLKIARDSYKTMKGSDSVNLQQKFRTEWEKLTKANQQEENIKKRNKIDFERILQNISTSLPPNSNPYWTLPYHPPSSEEDQSAHTIHNISYSKLFLYDTIVPSPGIRMVRPFSFPDHREISPERPKTKRSKKARFSPLVSGTKKKKKFTVTSVRESSLLKTSISEEKL